MLKQSKQAGFTLVELVMVIALIAILTTFALPSYQQMIQNASIRNAAESISSGLQLARAEAIKRNVNVQFNFRTGTGWTVCVSPATAGNCPATDNTTTIQSRSGNDGSSAAVTVTPTPAAVTGPYVFNSLGRMTGPAVAFNVVNAAEVGSRNLRILIGIGGTVKTCDPYSGLDANDPRKCP